MSHKPAGGLKSRQVTQKPVRYGAAGGAIKADLRGVSQIGQSIGNHITEKSKLLPNTIKPVRGGPMGGMGSVPLGNQIAGNVGAGGPGRGRVLYGQAGSQSTYGKPNPGANDRPSTKGQWPDAKR